MKVKVIPAKKIIDKSESNEKVTAKLRVTAYCRVSTDLEEYA